jgi:hypothetical protein
MITRRNLRTQRIGGSSDCGNDGSTEWGIITAVDHGRYGSAGYVWRADFSDMQDRRVLNRRDLALSPLPWIRGEYLQAFGDIILHAFACQYCAVVRADQACSQRSMRSRGS